MKPPLANDQEASQYVSNSVDAGGAKPSAKALYEQRKNYAKHEATLSEVSEYRVEVCLHYILVLSCHLELITFCFMRIFCDKYANLK